MKITTKEIYIFSIVKIEKNNQQLIEEVAVGLEEFTNKDSQLATLILKYQERRGRLPAEIVVDRSPAIKLDKFNRTK